MFWRRRIFFNNLREQEIEGTAGSCCKTIWKSQFICRQLKASSGAQEFSFFYVFADRASYITLANDQLEARLLYFIIRLLQSSTRFEQRRTHYQEVKLY